MPVTISTFSIVYVCYNSFSSPTIFLFHATRMRSLLKWHRLFDLWCFVCLPYFIHCLQTDVWHVIYLLIVGRIKKQRAETHILTNWFVLTDFLSNLKESSWSFDPNRQDALAPCELHVCHTFSLPMKMEQFIATSLD